MFLKKDEVERLLGYEITQEEFSEALKCARRKQNFIYQKEKRAEVLESWYLAELLAEYLRSNAFTQSTLDLCSGLYSMDMEKEHSASCQSAPTDIHIVAVPAL